MTIGWALGFAIRFLIGFLKGNQEKFENAF
jgi:hypothetical protein